MRLLCVQKPWKFVETEQPPPYAILSHTWYEAGSGKSGEVTYQEMCGYLNGTVKAKSLPAKGLDKIQQAIRIAAADGLKYIWIDTCCIDKTSLRELDEAIRRMFKWYKNAAICYAYLSDVSPVRNPDVDISPDLVQSRWFRRGWTLQELLAPSDVKFLARDWTVLGTRMGGERFSQALIDVTGINDDVMYGSVPLSEIPVAVRMRWASRRQTTRIEDLAYSLMGIFNVNMLVMYGEGEASFIRLQEEILKKTNDQSIFAWTLPDNSDNEICGLLADSPKRFADVVDMQPKSAPNASAKNPDEWQHTGQGLRLRLYSTPIARDQQTHYCAFLECTWLDANGTYLNPVLYFRRVEGDQFARVFPSKLAWTEYSRCIPGASYVTLYVKQNPSFRLPSLFVAHEHISGNNDKQMVAPRGFRLEGVCPTMFWNGRRFSRDKVQSLELPIALFRFARVTDPSCRVDVAVGFRVQGLDQPSVWHIQRTCGSEPIHKTFAQLNRPGGVDDALASRRRQNNGSAGADGWTRGSLVDTRVTITRKPWEDKSPPHEAFEIRVDG